MAMLAGLFALVLSGCASQAATRVGWSEYTTVPEKDYTVVGVVVVNPANGRTTAAELMAEAQKLGAHDIINVRLDEEFDSLGVKRILAASAVAIKYTDTLKDETSAPIFKTVDNGTSTPILKKGFFSGLFKKK
jgi:hypothetical protein